MILLAIISEINQQLENSLCKGSDNMKGFNTGYKDYYGNPFLVGSKVEWQDRDGWYCQSEIIVKDGCKIGIDSWEGFIFVCDFDVGVNGFKVSIDK